ncbi:carboxylating nicotinate-nucleotide diphosphorylase [Nocardioides marmoraquaticus]
MNARDLLAEVGLDPDEVLGLLRATLAEDLGDDRRDLTSELTVPVDARLHVAWVARQPGTVAGLPVVAALVSLVTGTEPVLLASDGERVVAGQRLAELEAPAREVLLLERTSLNLLGHLSGVATATRAWADAIEGTGARVRDTRKTMPLLRSLQKHAVRCGGGTNHRVGLFDAVLVKDNHVAAAGGVRAATRAAVGAPVVVQVEVDDLAQLDDALAEGAPQVLLDNFSLDDLRTAVERVRRVAPGTVVEASGGLTLDQARAVAETGVDLLAVGALTHSVVSLDVGLDEVG